MNKKIFSLAMCAIVSVLSFSAQAQQPAKTPRIGYLDGSLSANAARVEAFKQGLRELGYVEGKNLLIEWRSAEGKMDTLPALAAELVALKVDVIISGGPAVTRAAKNATTAIPIVMTADTDPVATGFVASLARPGGNITGMSTLAPEITGKQLELLKEIVPKLSRVAVFGLSTIAGNAQNLQELELAAKALKIKLQHLEIQNSKDIERAFRAARDGRADAVLVLPNLVIAAQRSEAVNLATKSRLPVMHMRADFVEAGGLMTYSAIQKDLDRRAATFVVKIFKGTKPADLPVEQPIKFEFVINLKAAKQIGLTIPPQVLARADRVIK